MKIFLTYDFKTAIREWLIHNISCSVKQIANTINRSVSFIYKLADTENEGSEHYCHLNVHQLLMITKCSGDFRLLDYIENECGRYARTKAAAGNCGVDAAALGLNESMARINAGLFACTRDGCREVVVGDLLEGVANARRYLSRIEEAFGAGGPEEAGVVSADNKCSQC